MSALSPQCSSANHGQCPGYYMTTHACECACHKKAAAITAPATADLLAKFHADTRVPPPELVHKKGQFDYVGHADATEMLLAHDPCWSWEPFALDDKGQPLVMYDAGGRPRAMWIRLTIHGHTRIGIGTCGTTAGDPYKELIGDAIRNAAMRFGLALKLWSTSEWVEAGDEARTEERTQSAPRGSAKENAPRSGQTTRKKASEPVLPKDQALAALAAQLGFDDDTRGDVIFAVTKGRTRSGKDLKPQEVEWVSVALSDLHGGIVELRYDENGTPRIGRVQTEKEGLGDETF